MRRNLVLIHLESVSQMAFWQYSAEMETLFNLMGRSAAFSNFQAASTSSVMSMSDLLHGDSSELDHLPLFPNDGNRLAGRSGNLFLTLLEQGYRTLGVQYGSFSLGDAPNNFWGVWPEACGQFRWLDRREEMYLEIRDFLEKSRAAGQPFALYYWNLNTHLRDEDPLKDKNLAYHERFQAGYRLLDLSVKRLLDDLAALGLLQDTLIAAFGDHGDDLWRHGCYRGRSHAIDPYANVAWCPLFIYNNGHDVCVSAKMVSMIDLKPTLRHLLLPELAPEPPATPFSGIDILAASRSVAFAQSMFALQIERSDPARAMTKSYAVTNGELRLLASTGSDFDDSGGLELYLEQWDHGDTRNLLDFCRLDASGEIIAFAVPEAVHPHFFMTLNPGTIRDLLDGYRNLRRLLAAFIKQKETEALKLFSGGPKHLFPDAAFARARKRKW
ncbi:MAG: sulfatase-like hydrolase/transferase [Planctomycetota bacterium]|jgi:arylsulfatase A-like enzyme|nr:sulfatase-like hydrolase/transferase [Planctomycetota bacterium]